MTKLSLNKKQEEMLYMLRLEGMRRQIELAEAEEAYKTAQVIEKSVEQYVVDDNEYFADCPDIPEMHGSRITDAFDVCMINPDIFEADYLPKIKAAYMSIYGIDNPLNFVYSSPMRERRLKAQRSYRMIAVDFLKIAGRPEAAQLEEAVKTYLSPKLAERLEEINEKFINAEI